MYIVAIGWMFVVVCMAAVEATTGAFFGALGTLVFYGLLPLALFLWLFGAPQRRRNRTRGTTRPTGASFGPPVGKVPDKSGYDARDGHDGASGEDRDVR